MILNNLQFRGIVTDDLNKHLKWFLQLYDTFTYNKVIDDAIFAQGSIMTWDELPGKFLQKFFPISKRIQLRRGTTISKNLEGESFNEVWECFKTLI
ncbi:oligopeptide transporter 4-like [Gossypium australe]|uniref:Oligopeptide transporter 4-like n=1 Tax=Gossypium australe TaxID=47621 RepID=A0A5B6W8S2_9ROSI|nr:oligopeptide transporter 4-like [Gossypium australe]